MQGIVSCLRVLRKQTVSPCLFFHIFPDIFVSGKRVFTSKAEKISICFEGMHESGSLYHMLSHFIYNGINMNHIESRPVQGKNWEYRFFVDFEGNLNDAAVQNALRGLAEETLGLKILGNY